MQFPDTQFSNQFSNLVIPTLPSLNLSQAEQAMVLRLQNHALRARFQMELAEAYYLGAQIVTNLRIGVPAELEFINPILGWPTLAVDPYVERHAIDCFRLPNGSDADQYLTDIGTANGLDAELPLAITDALSMGRSMWMVGSPLEAGDVPRITVESPLNMTVLWDLRGLEAEAALNAYWQDGRQHADLLMPGKTVTIATDDNGQWKIADRDDHGFDFVPVHRMVNQSRTNDRMGRSAITPALRYEVDSTCRTLLGLEVSREIYSTPGMVLLGAAEKSFQNVDGTPKTAWQTYITSVLGLERDENGELPDFKQKTVYDPAVFTKLVDSAAARVASIVLAPPQDIGLYTEGNPVSAEAQNTSEARRNRRARSQQRGFGVTIGRVMQTAARFDNDGVLPAKYKSVATDWVDVEEVSFAQASLGITQLVAEMVLPPTSDVVLKRLGFNAVDRARLEQDRKREDGRAAAKAIAAAAIPGLVAPPTNQPTNGPANVPAGQQ